MRELLLQLARGVILVFEICVMVFAFTKLGLIESHAVFTIYPLLVAALSGPVLSEKADSTRLRARQRRQRASLDQGEPRGAWRVT